MSLTDEAQAEMPEQGGVCGVKKLLDQHPELADELAEALAAPVYGTAIAVALRHRYGDSAPSYQSIQRHRKGRCVCG